MNNLHLENLKKVYLKVHRDDAGNGGKAFKSDWFIYTFRLEPEWDAPELFRESFGDEWKLASERISIQPRAPTSGLERVKQSASVSFNSKSDVTSPEQSIETRNHLS